MAKRVSPRRVRAAQERFTAPAAEFNALRESIQELRDELRLQFKRIAQIQVEIDTLKRASITKVEPDSEVLNVSASFDTKDHGDQ